MYSLVPTLEAYGKQISHKHFCGKLVRPSTERSAAQLCKIAYLHGPGPLCNFVTQISTDSLPTIQLHTSALSLTIGSPSSPLRLTHPALTRLGKSQAE